MPTKVTGKKPSEPPPPPNWLVSIVKALLFVFNSVPAIGSHGDSTATLEVALDVPADGFVLRT